MEAGGVLVALDDDEILNTLEFLDAAGTLDEDDDGFGFDEWVRATFEVDDVPDAAVPDVDDNPDVEDKRDVEEDPNDDVEALEDLDDPDDVENNDDLEDDEDVEALEDIDVKVFFPDNGEYPKDLFEPGDISFFFGPG